MGFSLKKFGRFIDRRTKAVMRTVKKVPVVGSVVKGGEGLLKGPVGRTFDKILKNPVIQTVFAPVAIPAHMAYAGTTDGMRGLQHAAKETIKNPVLRATVSAVGTIFPPAAPAALALQAANMAWDAAEKGKPADMIKAAASIAAAQAGASIGDPHLTEVAKVLDKAQALRKAAPGIKFPDIHGLNAGWLGSTRANEVLEAKHPDAHLTVQPALVQQAVNVLHTAGTVKNAQVAPPNLEHAKGIVAHALALGHMHPHIPFFVDLAAATHKALGGVMGANNIAAKSIVADLENRIMAHTKQRTAELNALVLGYNAQHPDAVTKVNALRTQHAHGDHSATAYLDDMRRRTAALKKAKEYKVDTKGYVRHGGSGHPAAQPAKPPMHAAGHAAHAPAHH